jgi:hypothetical protein
MKTALVVVSLIMINCSSVMSMENRDRQIVNRESEQFKKDWIDCIQWSYLDKDYKGYALDCIKNNTDPSGKLSWQNARRDIECLKRGVPVAQGPALWSTFVSTYSFLLTLYMNINSANHYGPVSDVEEQSQQCRLDFDALRTMAPVLALLHAVGAAYEFKSSVKFDVDRRVRPSYFSDGNRLSSLVFLCCTGLVDDSFLCSAGPSFHGAIVAMQCLKLFTVCVPLYLMLSTSSPDCENSGCTQLLKSCVRKGRFLRGDTIQGNCIDRIIKFCDEYSKKES